MSSVIIERKTKVKHRPVFDEPGVKIDICGRRSYMLWEKFTQQGPKVLVSLQQWFNHGVMLNVELSAIYHPQVCGGDYAGHAFGELYEGKSWSHPQERRLKFNHCDGQFTDAETGQRLYTVSVLMLRDNLKSAYLP